MILFISDISSENKKPCLERLQWLPLVKYGFTFALQRPVQCVHVTKVVHHEYDVHRLPSDWRNVLKLSSISCSFRKLSTLPWIFHSISRQFPSLSQRTSLWVRSSLYSLSHSSKNACNSWWRKADLVFRILIGFIDFTIFSCRSLLSFRHRTGWCIMQWNASSCGLICWILATLTTSYHSWCSIRSYRN